MRTTLERCFCTVRSVPNSCSLIRSNTYTCILLHLSFPEFVAEVAGLNSTTSQTLKLGCWFFVCFFFFVAWVKPWKFLVSETETEDKFLISSFLIISLIKSDMGLIRNSYILRSLPSSSPPPLHVTAPIGGGGAIGHIN